MILDAARIPELIRNPASFDYLKKAKDLQDVHKVHINGVGYQDYIKQIIGYENTEQYAQKKELAEPVTPLLTKKIRDEQGRWKSVAAKKYFEWKDNARREKEFKGVLSQVWKGESISYFIRHFFSDALYTEFNGFVIVEQPKIERDGETWIETRDGIRQVMLDKIPRPYLIFRPVESIIDFKSRGNRVEYLIIDWGKETRPEGDVQLYRVIDDQWDRIYEEVRAIASPDGRGDSVVESKVYPPIRNTLGYVPAVQISTYRENVSIDEVKTSPINHIIPHLKTFLTLWAEHVITCILHSHPIYYQLGQACRYEDKETGARCDTGILSWTTIEGEPQTKTCPECKGVGYMVRRDASAAIFLPQVDDEGRAYDIRNVAGYVNPPVEALTQQIKELDWLKEDILMAGTGMNKMAETQIEKTATEAILNYKPLEKIIGEILDNLEYVETFLTDTIGKLYYGRNYQRSEISYSRSLNLRDENTVLTEIEQAKKAGASSSYIRTLHRELIHTRYQNNVIDLERNMMLEQLEPFIGYTPEEMYKYFSKIVDNEDLMLKVYFSDYIVQFEEENGLITDFMENSLMKDRLKAIKDILITYNKENLARLDLTQPADSDPQSAGNQTEGEE